jgi:hypothetical protein
VFEVLAKDAIKTLKMMITEEKHTDTSFQNFDMIFKNETFCTAAIFSSIKKWKLGKKKWTIIQRKHTSGVLAQTYTGSEQTYLTS